MMEELRAGIPMVFGDVTIVPIERSSLQCGAGVLGCWLSGFKEPIAVILSDAAGVRAFDMEAAEIPLASLVRKIPNLRAPVAK